MANRRYPFQGQFGMHETKLTTVISEGEFKAAEQIIEAVTDPTFLNEGRYQDIPLHMVLTNNHYAKRCRNLKLARLLVEKGASANLRIHYEDMDQAPSPFEELVVYHEVLKAHVAGASESLCEELEMYFETEELKMEFLTNTVDLDNTKCLPNLEHCEKLVGQTSDLVDVFLRCGSDPSVITTFSHKSLFHWVIEHEDIDLAKRFLDTCRVHVNLCDIHGTSPLMDCILRNNADDALALYEAMCDTADYVDTNTRDCCGETALFRAVFVGATEMVDRLCKDGVKMWTRVHLSQAPVSTCKEPRIIGAIYSRSLMDKVSPMITPFLAPLLSESPVRLRYTQVSSQDSDIDIISFQLPHKQLVDKIISASISPLLDSGCFSDPTVALEVTSLLKCTKFDYLLSGDVSAMDLMAMKFGQVSAGLRQLCVRTIFGQCLTVSQKPDKVWPKSENDVFCTTCCDGSITPKETKDLVEILGLPPSFQIFFDIEAAKYQTCSFIMNLRSMECDKECSAASEESMFDDDDDESYDSEFSRYPNSDSLLFCSSDISDESSEEIDDLSDEDLSGSEEDVAEDAMKAETSKQGAPELKKIKYEPESSASESENMRVVVEVFCEDLAEGEDHPAVCRDKYQRLTDESTTTTTTASPENLTPSDSISDSVDC